jgi:hypothetical protein
MMNLTSPSIHYQTLKIVHLLIVGNGIEAKDPHI